LNLPHHRLRFPQSSLPNGTSTCLLNRNVPHTCTYFVMTLRTQKVVPLSLSTRSADHPTHGPLPQY
jgi:hypothetical protein